MDGFEVFLDFPLEKEEKEEETGCLIKGFRWESWIWNDGKKLLMMLNLKWPIERKLFTEINRGLKFLILNFFFWRVMLIERISMWNDRWWIIRENDKMDIEIL